MILDALCSSDAEPAVRRLAEAFGGDPVEVSERLVGDPAVRSRRLSFASGGEIILHDDAVVAVLLHLVPTSFAPGGFDLSDWIAGARNDAMFGDLKELVDAPWKFGAGGAYCFVLDGGYLRLEFSKFGGYTPGDLRYVAVTAEEPWLVTRPEDDGCPACAGLLVRRSEGGVDVEDTISALVAGVDAGTLADSTGGIPLADLQLLHASRLMERVESQLTCTTCDRAACLTLYRDAPPTFGYHLTDQARQRPLDAIPPVELWGDESRITADRGAMHYVDHEPGAWYLVERQGVLHLDARYVVSSMVDSSALIRLDDSELEAYRDGGHEYLSHLARRIHDDSPHRETSEWYPRNVYRGPDGKALRDEVSAAIVNHTWLAENRRKV